jgi:hypothetical protein
MIELGAVASPTDTTANGGGITLLGATNKTITYDNTNNNWTSSENWNIATGKTFKINNVSMLSSTALGSTVVGSSLTSVGTIGTGVWQGTVVGSTYGGTGVNNGANTLTLAGNVSHAGAFTQTFTATGNTSLTLPTAGTLATLIGSETLTNKTIAAGSNTISGLTNSNLSGTAGITNANVANTTISGVALGGTLFTLTIGTGLSGSSYNGSAAITIANSGVLSIAGTTNQITASASTGAVTLSTPQNLHTGTDFQVNSLGVGTAASTTAGQIRATSTITAYYSDSRLKTFLGTIPNALDKVLSLNGYYFVENEKAKELGYNNDERQVGVSAQEVDAVMPEVVVPAPINGNFPGADYKTVHYERLVPLLIEAIKEQQIQIEALKAKLGM